MQLIMKIDEAILHRDLLDKFIKLVKLMKGYRKNVGLTITVVDIDENDKISL